MNPPFRYWSWPFLTFCIALLSSCGDTTIDPFQNEGNYYTVYGFLDDLENTHVLRVIPVTRRAERINSPTDDQASIDAVVYTTDLNTGIRTKWAHSLEKMSDGSYGHIYRASFLVTAQKRYKLEIIRSDGKMTTAITEVPTVQARTYLNLAPRFFLKTHRTYTEMSISRAFLLPGRFMASTCIARPRATICGYLCPTRDQDSAQTMTAGRSVLTYLMIRLS